MRRIVLLGAAALLPVALAAAILGFRQSSAPSASGPPPGPYRGSEPPDGIRAPDFALRSYRGGLVRMRDLRGKVVVITFLNTACREQCPVIARVIGDALPLLPAADRGRVVALAISVDPKVDTPVRVRAFLRRRRALGLDWLIGPVRELRPVWRGFHVLAAVDSGKADVHSASVNVYDGKGVWVSALHAGVDLTPANLAHDAVTALTSSHRTKP